jgi:four helix bundle protein
MHNYRKLNAYQRAKKFGQEVYRLTGSVVRPEHRTVTAQLRRSALSISATIAEGCGKASRAETIRYLEMSCGSTVESEHHLGMAIDLGILPERHCAELINEAVHIGRMLRRLIENFPP